MKYISAEKVMAEIERLKNELHYESFTDEVLGKQTILKQMLRFIESMEQEQLTPPGIEDEEKKQGWLDYGLTVGEIGLHRYNAIQRIKEHKEKFSKQDIPCGILYDVSEYYEAVGMEKAMCCLQAWCRDFRFTQEDVKEIINKEE